jgi:hypothetical protein
MTDITTAQKIACEDMLRDVARLAREAEEADAPPQGHALAQFAEAVANGDMARAMHYRDSIARELRHARNLESDGRFTVYSLTALVALLSSPFWWPLIF